MLNNSGLKSKKNNLELNKQLENKNESKAY